MMKTKFDKIYVLSLITNKERQEFIKYQFNKLELDFEFIYGTDFYNIENNAKHIKIDYPDVWKLPVNYGESSKNFGCALSHYNAVLYAYEFGYNNILIIEDDICLTKNIELLNHYLNNMPEDADFITYDLRFELIENQKKFVDMIRHNFTDWQRIYNNVNIIGGMMYGIMNRKTIQLYLESQRKEFNMSDHINNIFDNSKVNRYVSTKCICTDQYNIKNHFNSEYVWYENIYNKINKLNDNDFFNMNDISINVSNLLSRENKLP